MGKFDLVPQALMALGVQVLLHKIAQKPGKPMWFGINREGKVVFALPGNPVSSMVTFDLFVRPALARMQGAPGGQLRVVWAELTEPFKQVPGRRHFVRGIVSADNGKNAVRLAGRQGSAMLGSMAAANCLVIVPEDATELPAGSKVRIALLDGTA